MSRIRNVRPEFFRHEGLQELERNNPGKYPMFVFEGLWTKCDRQGVFEWKPNTLKLDILPFLEFDMTDSLSVLLRSKFIKKFTVEGKEYGIVPTFLKHQKISSAEQNNKNIFPLPTDQPDLFDDFVETTQKPPSNGSETHSEPFQNPGNSEYGNSEILNTDPVGSAGDQKHSVSQKPKKIPLRQRDPENSMEQVEKAYLKNWDSLFDMGIVKTPEPVVNWNQTRHLLKKHFEKLKPDYIIRALENGMSDNFVVSGGYSLGTMLSATVLNRLINSSGKFVDSPSSRKQKKSLGGLET
jgi:hypothetical protein